MYNTSSAYKAAIARKLQSTRLVITVTPKSGTPFTVTDANLVPKSVSFSNKSSKNSDFSFGAAYVGAFNFTMLNVNDTVDRYSLYEAKVAPVVYQDLGNNTEEAIPMGEFYVETPTRAKKTIAIKAYDAMTRFDVPQVVDTFGTPYQLLDLLCTTCAVPLGMTEQEVEALPNGTEQLTMSAERVRTCRDALSYISTVLCGFATIDRSGQLVIRQYASTKTLTIGKERRTVSTIADYSTYFIGVRARFLQSGNWVKVTANVQGATSGLVLDLGDVPMVQGVNETLMRVAQTIADELGEISFTPSDVSITGDPSIDLGDLIEYTNANNTSDTVYTPITSIIWKHHGVTQLKGEGGNARLNAVSDYQTKQIATVETDATVNEYAMKFYTNSEQITVDSTDTIVVVLNYSVYKDTTTAFACTIPFVMAKDGNLVFTYALNNDDIGEFTHYVPRGSSLVTLTNYIVNAGNSQNRLTLRVHAEYFESDKRKQDAQIGGLIDFTTTGEYVERAIDTTVPSGYVPQTGIRAYIFASGINTSDSWDGNLLIIERIQPIQITVPTITVTPLTESANAVTSQVAQTETYTEHISAVTLAVPQIAIVSVTDFPIIGRKTMAIRLNPLNASEYVFSPTYVNVTETAFSLRLDYTFISQTGVIDSGYMSEVEIPIDNFDSITTMTVTSNYSEGNDIIMENGDSLVTEGGDTIMEEG